MCHTLTNRVNDGVSIISLISQLVFTFITMFIIPHITDITVLELLCITGGATTSLFTVPHSDTCGAATHSLIIGAGGR